MSRDQVRKESKKRYSKSLSISEERGITISHSSISKTNRTTKSTSLKENISMEGLAMKDLKYSGAHALGGEKMKSFQHGGACSGSGFIHILEIKDS